MGKGSHRHETHACSKIRTSSLHPSPNEFILLNKESVLIRTTRIVYNMVVLKGGRMKLNMVLVLDDAIGTIFLNISIN